MSAVPDVSFWEGQRPKREAIVVVVPVLNRPERVEPLLASLERGRDGIPYDALFVVSPGDAAELEALERAGVTPYPPAEALAAPSYITVSWEAGPGDWARKINHAAEVTTEPWLFTGADDLCFCPGWANRAFECAFVTGADVVGTNDLGHPLVLQGETATHSLIRRAYITEHGTIDEPGKALHEGYDHNFPDRELVDTAKARGAWAFCGASKVEHLHHHWGKGTDDATYRKGQAQFAADRLRFRRRSRLWAR